MLPAHGLGAAGRDAPRDQCVHDFQIGRPEPGHHQMRGIPPVCMHTGQEGTGSVPVRQPLASPKLPPGAGDWRR
jgi:hypothetical protein